MAFGKRLGDPKAGWVGFIAVAAAFVAALVTWLGLLTHITELRQETKNALPVDTCWNASSRRCVSG